MPIKNYTFDKLTGGGAGSLDGGDIVGNGNNLNNGDGAMGIVSGMLHVYRLNASSSDSENSPARIAPNTNPGTKMWELKEILLPIGGALSSFRPGGVIHVNTTAVGTDADTAEKNLMTFSLPANTLNANGKGLRITSKVSTAANANGKTIKLYFGAAAIWTSAGNVNNELFNVDCIIFRTSAGNQKGTVFSINVNGDIQNIKFTKTENETAAITIKITGQNVVAQANDIVAELFLIEFLN